METMKIFESKQEAENAGCYSPYGNFVYHLNKEQIQALLDGKILADPELDEYGMIIQMEDEPDEAN